MKTDTVGVVIPTFGNFRTWWYQGFHARKSIQKQSISPDQLICIHGENITDTRNVGWNALNTEWVIFLDADDTLDVHYIEDMLNAEGDVRYPLVSYDNQPPYRIEHSTDDLLGGNYIVIGAMVRRECMIACGGFRPLPYWDDWDLWLRIQKLGYSVKPSNAIYRAVTRPGSMNSRDVVDPERIYERYLMAQDSH